MSLFGAWTTLHDLPAFAYTVDHRSVPDGEWAACVGRDGDRLNWVGVGNRRIQLFADNEGGVALWDEGYGLRWLTAPDPAGTGFSLVEVDGGASWGTSFEGRPPGPPPRRIFGPTWFCVATEHEGLTLERTMLCPEGEAPWVLVRVRLAAGAHDVHLRHREVWAVRPRFANQAMPAAMARDVATRCIRFRVTAEPWGLMAREERTDAPDAVPLGQIFQGGVVVHGPPARGVFGPTSDLRLEALGGAPVQPEHDGADHPTLVLASDVHLEAGEKRDLWFRFGVDDGSVVDDPGGLFDASLRQLGERLPRARAERAPMAGREVPWHAALLTGGACADGVLGGHTLNESGSYSFVLGLNIAARDPLQHALPLVYCEPDLALSVLRNTCSWAAPNGVLPWALDGEKNPLASEGPWPSDPSDVSLWALWLASEYAIATGDLECFAAPVGFHPVHNAPPVSLFENLRRQYRFLVDGVGLGENGHLRIRGCDWADGFIGAEEAGIDRVALKEKGESVLNSAMAAWILPLWAYVCDRNADAATATEARELAERLRVAVAGEWNGQWFRRARCGEATLGDDNLILEVQPWAILCGAADDAQARTLLHTIDERCRAGSPLGARRQWPLPRTGRWPPGEALSGGVWFAVDSPLVWAAARHDPDLAWDEWRRLTLASHAAAYPNVWEGTLSGPDAYNAPESPRPGHTFAPSNEMFPVNNSHSHAHPLLSYLRLCGVEPRPNGALQVGDGGAFSSRSFEVRAGGGGRLTALGPVELDVPGRTVKGGPGEVTW